MHRAGVAVPTILAQKPIAVRSKNLTREYMPEWDITGSHPNRRGMNIPIPKSLDRHGKKSALDLKHKEYGSLGNLSGIEDQGSANRSVEAYGNYGLQPKSRFSRVYSSAVDIIKKAKQERDEP